MSPLGQKIRRVIEENLQQPKAYKVNQLFNSVQNYKRIGTEAFHYNLPNINYL